MQARPEDYAWPSARLHLGRRKTDPLNTDHHVVKIMGDWCAFLREGVSEEDQGLERRVSTGRPWADSAFVEQLGRHLNRRKGVPRTKGRTRGRHGN